MEVSVNRGMGMPRRNAWCFRSIQGGGRVAERVGAWTGSGRKRPQHHRVEEIGVDADL
jgi:hypothetical protein